MTPDNKLLNLDKIAGEQAQEMIKNVKYASGKKAIESLERVVTKTLGVLQEQGVYAMMLFLFSRSSEEERVATYVCTQLINVLGEIPVFEDKRILPDKNAKADIVLEFYLNNIVNSLDTLLLVRDLYDQTLIYARYSAKAAKQTKDAEPPAGG